MYWDLSCEISVLFAEAPLTDCGSFTDHVALATIKVFFMCWQDTKIEDPAYTTPDQEAECPSKRNFRAPANRFANGRQMIEALLADKQARGQRAIPE